jgi:hypothetical protein
MNILCGGETVYVVFNYLSKAHCKKGWGPHHDHSISQLYPLDISFKDDVTFILPRGYFFIGEIFDTFTSPNLVLHGSCKNLDDDNSSSVIYFITFYLSPRSFILVGNSFKKMLASEKN